MKKCIVLLLCMSVMFGLFGCHKTRERSKESKETTQDVATEGSEIKADEPLTLYYVKNDHHQGITMLLGWYRSQKNAVKVEAVDFSSAEELEQALQQGDQPDLIMLDKISSGTEIDPFMWIREGYAAGLNSYLEADESFDTTNYIAGTLEVGRYEAEQYILPLSVANQYLVTNEEELESGTLSALDGGYTTRQLMEELIRDAQEHEDETYFTHIPFFYDMNGMGSWIYDILELTGALHVDRNKGIVEVDEELFAQTMAYMKVLIDDANLLYGGSMDMNNVEFVDMEGYCTVVLTDRNAPYMTRYMSSACHQLLQQEMTVLPFALQEGGYAVNINVMGMVGADSNQQEAAYQVLRTMMDVPKEKWESVNVGDTFVQMSSVNKDVALGLVESFLTMDKGNFRVLGSMIQREPLTEEQAVILRDMIENNQCAYITDVNIVSAIESYVYPNVSVENADWAKIARDTAQAIENGM